MTDIIGKHNIMMRKIINFWYVSLDEYYDLEALNNNDKIEIIAMQILI